MRKNARPTFVKPNCCPSAVDISYPYSKSGLDSNGLVLFDPRQPIDFETGLNVTLDYFSLPMH